MWIVKLVLRRPYTFAVMALAILAGGLAIARMAADIFPDINIPIVAVVWQYSGLTPEEMSSMVTTRSERGMTTTVNEEPGWRVDRRLVARRVASRTQAFSFSGRSVPRSRLTLRDPN